MIKETYYNTGVFSQDKKISLKKVRATTKKVMHKVSPYLLLAPAVSLLVTFIIYPLCYTLYLSFFEWNMVSPTKEFVWFENYYSIFTNDAFFKITTNTVVYIALMLLLTFVAPYIFSYLLAFVLKKGKEFYKRTIFLPSVISLTVSTMIFVWILNPVSGPVSSIMSFFGLEMPVWSVTPGLVLAVISFITSWKIFGYNFIIVLAGVSAIPYEIIEATSVDKIPKWRVFLDVVVPMSSATGIYVLILAIIQGLQQVYTPINMVTRGGPDNASTNFIYVVYQEAFSFFKTGQASAYAILMMLFFAVLIYFEFKYVERGVHYEN